MTVRVSSEIRRSPFSALDTVDGEKPASFDMDETVGKDLSLPDARFPGSVILSCRALPCSRSSFDYAYARTETCSLRRIYRNHAPQQVVFMLV
jgi:hypothetical protein